jgi:tyrosine-protein kinase Etk/Wzc
MSTSSQQHDRGAEDREKVTVLDFLIALAKHKKSLLAVIAVAVIVSAAIALAIPNTYTAVAKILPPQQTQSTSAVLAQLGNLAGLGGAGAAAGIKNPNDLYVGMLKSRTVADNLIQRFELNKVYHQKYQSLTRRKLEQATLINAGRDGIITIQVEDKDPRRAAELANAYVDELFKLTKVLATTEASQRRLFFERQLEQAKENLARSEVLTKQALEKGGLVLVEGEGRVMAETSARLRAEITVKEIQIGAMRTFAADQNPEMQRAVQQVEVLKRELARVEGKPVATSNPKSETNVKGIENLRLLRDMKYNEATYELLAKQYEIAKIDEAKDSAIIQVMDRAIEPDRKSKPNRTLIVFITTLAASVLASLWLFAVEAVARSDRGNHYATRWLSFKRHLRTWGRTSGP